MCLLIMACKACALISWPIRHVFCYHGLKRHVPYYHGMPKNHRNKARLIVGMSFMNIALLYVMLRVAYLGRGGGGSSC